MKKILVIGASGFVGKYLANALLAERHAVRCLARTPAKVQELAVAGCEIVQGDITDPESMQRAFSFVEAAYVSVHTLVPQNPDSAGQDFMDLELNGLQNIVTACRTNGVRRLIYVTFLGVSPDAPSAWIRGRWKAEQFLLNSGLDVTIIRPGMIVGVGGQGFNMMVSRARKSTALVLGSGQQKFRTIALSDLGYYLVGVLNDPRAYGQAYDVGSDDVLSGDQLIDRTAEVLGRPRPKKMHILLPKLLLDMFAPLVERITKMPKGALNGFLDSMKTDSIGDPTPIRILLPRPMLSYRQSVEHALANPGKSDLF